MPALPIRCRSGRFALAVTCSAALLGACSGDSAKDLDTASTSTTVAVSTTVAAPTSVAATSTTTLTTAVVLRNDGLVVAAFGTPVDAAIAAIAAVLGPAASDVITEFPNADGDVRETADGSTGFALPVGRTVCWAELCIYGGAADAASVAFVGWTYVGIRGAPLAVSMATADGLTLGSRWADFPAAMTVQPGGCPTSGSGSTADGITLQVSGGVFSTIDTTGEYTEQLPAVDTVVVDGLSAGFTMFALESGC